MTARLVSHGAAASLARTAAAAAVALLCLAQPAVSLFDNGTLVAPCNSTLYCYGDLLQAIQLAAPFSDSKTFVDMPTVRPLDEVVAAFRNLSQPVRNDSALQAFLGTYFAAAGGELESVPEDELTTNATFLSRVADPVVHEFVQKVMAIWPDLTRRYTGRTGNTSCAGCQSSFVPVSRTFVVAGGRFREPYYWDSFWILEGLLRTGGSFVAIARNTIENFLDLVDLYGFVPNGARVYYLNRSQPPLLAQMVRLYVEHTGDATILARAVPLLEREHAFWTANRSVAVVVACPDGDGGGSGGSAPTTRTYTLNRYAVRNNQPRPESFLEDYVTAHNRSYYAADGTVYPVPPQQALDAAQQAALYAQLASGAESGWDYGTRWLARPGDAVSGTTFPLRSLNIDNLLPVDLNAILYWNEVTLAGFLNATGNASAAARWAQAAADRSEAMHALMWNDTLFRYFDYNLSSRAQSIYVPRDPATAAAAAAAAGDAAADDLYTAPPGQQVLFDVAQLYPFWTGAAPAQLKDDPRAVRRAFARVEAYLDTYAGGIPATNLQTGQQWDQPNVWPPLQHVLMQGLLNTPAPGSSGSSGSSGGGGDAADCEADYRAVQQLAQRLAQRYLDSTFCTWYATGGSTSETPQLQGFDASVNGTMFEKYTFNATNGAGSGGEYTVVEGFGWTNGVLLWAADIFGAQLARPNCGNITAASVTPAKRSADGGAAGADRRRPRPPSAVQLDPYDARWIKMFGRRG